MTITFSAHGMERYNERVLPLYPSTDPETLLKLALRKGFNLYELDKDTRRQLSRVQHNSKAGNCFIFYNCFAFIFRYQAKENNYHLITVHDLPSKVRFKYGGFMRD